MNRPDGRDLEPNRDTSTVRLIIAGSRDLWLPLDTIEAYVRGCGVVPNEIVSGGAAGIDRCGERWAKRAGLPIKRFPADWLRYGPSAGPVRNRVMAAYANAALLIWEGEQPTPGTASMLAAARKAGLQVTTVGGRHMHPMPSRRAGVEASSPKP